MLLLLFLRAIMAYALLQGGYKRAAGGSKAAAAARKAAAAQEEEEAASSESEEEEEEEGSPAVQRATRGSRQTRSGAAALAGRLGSKGA